MPPHPCPPNRPASTRASSATVLDTHTGIIHRKIRMTGNKCAPPPDNRAAMTWPLDCLNDCYDTIVDAPQLPLAKRATRSVPRPEGTL